MINKRPPDTFPDGDIFWQFHRITKADWADLFADLYREAMGPEDASPDEIMADVQRRLGIIKSYRKSYDKAMQS